jgi:hypothetical protein
MATTQLGRTFPAATRQTPRARLTLVTAAPAPAAAPREPAWWLASQLAGGAAALATSAALWAWFLAATW